MHTWKEEHLAFLNADVPEFLAVHDAEEHPALVLVEPLLRAHNPSVSPRFARGVESRRTAHLGLVHMVVVALVRAADDHDDEVLVEAERVQSKGCAPTMLRVGIGRHLTSAAYIDSDGVTG